MLIKCGFQVIRKRSMSYFYTEEDTTFNKYFFVVIMEPILKNERAGLSDLIGWWVFGGIILQVYEVVKG